MLILSVSAAFAQPQTVAPSSESNGRFDLNVWAGFISGQDLRVLLVEAPWRMNRYISLAPAYAHAGSPAFNAQQLRGSATVQLPLRRFVLDDRNMFVRTFVPTGGTTLYRNRLRLSYPIRIRGKQASLFVADELFYDWRPRNWARNWVYAGGSYDFSRNVGAQVYYLRQHRLGGIREHTLVSALIVRFPGLIRKG